MKKFKTIVLLFLACVISSYAAPKIWLSDTTINFGHASYKMGSLSKTIKVKNIGTDTLHIYDVHPTCGCTVAPISQRDIAVGDSAQIEVTFDISQYSGEIEKTLTVRSNDTTHPYVVIVLNINVERAFEIVPRYLNFERLYVGEPSTASVDIVNRSNTDAVVKSVAVDNPDVIVTIKPDDVVKKGEKFKVTATTIATHKGSTRATIRIELYHPDDNYLQIICFGNAIEKPQK